MHPPVQTSTRAGVLMLLALLVAVAAMLGEGAGVAERGALLRVWSLLASAVFAVAVPHVLLPDPQGSLTPLLNPPPAALLARQFRRWGGVVALLAVPLVVLAAYDPGAWGRDLGAKAWHGIAGLLVVAGVGTYAFIRYMTLGQVSQAWQEGRRGGWYRRYKEHATTAIPLPDGLVPALFVTAHVFVVGALVTALGGYAERAFGTFAAVVPGLAFAAYAATRLLGLRRVYDRHFYSTNAFYTEVYRRAGGVHVSEREPVTFAALYWVPGFLRPHVWAALRQLDRRLPLGRLVFLGHLGLWMLFYQDAGADIVTAYLLLFIAAKNAVVYLVATPTFAPPAFQVALQAPGRWIATRFFVNFRWTPPFLLSLVLVALFDDALGYEAAALWTGLDLLISLLTAALFTYAAEVRYRRRYA